MTMSDLQTVLDGTGYSFAHFAWAKVPDGDYGVFGEDMGNEFHIGNIVAEQTLEGVIDYFTKSNPDTARTTIQNALTNAGVNFSLDSIQYEYDTGFVHLSWRFYLG